MEKEHRRELYSPASPEAGMLPEAVGPDQVPVTLRVEPAVDRYRRWRFVFLTPPVLTAPVRAYAGYRVLPGLLQRHLLRDRWAIDVEADSGERHRVLAADREQAVSRAREIHAGVTRDGVAFLRSLAR